MMPNTKQLPHQTDKNSQRRCSIKKVVLENFAIFTGKHLYWNVFLIKLPAISPATLLERYPNKGIFLLRNF